MQESGTISETEIAQFDKLAAEWWAPRGPMRALHEMNPLRATWIVDRVNRHGMVPGTLLDVGCGAGLLAEALAAKGIPVLGLDAAPAAIAAAQAHAEGRDLPLSYRLGRVEELVAEGQRFPVVTALEVIEHVPDAEAFVAALEERNRESAERIKAYCDAIHAAAHEEVDLPATIARMRTLTKSESI